MASSPWDPEVLYYGSQYLHRTRDKGVTWEKISPDLTAHDPCCQAPSGEPITRDVTGEEFYSTLYAITESPLERGVIWTGANDGPVSVTRDNGKTWATVTPKDLPTGGRVQWIDVSPHRRGSAYVAVYRYLLGDYQPYLYRTDDYGKTWTRLTDGKNGIPADWPTRVVREDPDREGLLYAGTEFGMFISFDNGAHWQSFQLNLPATPITDIKVYQKNLIVSTQGRSIWMLDNVTPLHQVTPAVVPVAASVFKPRDGYRTRVSPERLGPQIDYYLPSVPAGPVTVEILDAKGGLVNRYSSDAAAPAGGGRAGRAGGAGAGGGGGGDATAADPDAAPGGGRGGGAFTSRVTKTEGMNRFVWDVRHQNGLARLRQLSGARHDRRQAFCQPLTVLVDPQLAAEGLTAADLQAQFDHNVRMRELVTAANKTVQRVRAAQTQLKSATALTPQRPGRSTRSPASSERDGPLRQAGLQAHIYVSRGHDDGRGSEGGQGRADRYRGAEERAGRDHPAARPIAWPVAAF
jgi:hypothetical protein